jgi:hypothetical protein
MMRQISRAGIAHEQVSVVWRERAAQAARVPLDPVWWALFAPSAWWWRLALESWRLSVAGSAQIVGFPAGTRSMAAPDARLARAVPARRR